MKPVWRRRRIGTLLVLAGLVMPGGSLLAQHAATRDPYTGQRFPELMHSSDIRSTTAAADTCTVDVGKELVITDLSVVEDCYRTSWDGTCSGHLSPATRGAWSFARAMEGAFGTTDQKDVSKRVRQWLHLWMEDQIVNGDLVEARTAMRDLVLKPWEKASAGGHLDLKKAPFRLLALVFRMDLGRPITAPAIDSAGEFRLVYGVLDENGDATPFTVILEYRLEARSCQEIIDWIQTVHALSSYEFGPAYNAALQAITDRIITPGALPQALNQSALLAVRTNETFLGTPWEMRSFALALPEDDDSNQPFKARLVHQFNELTPAARYQGSQTLADFIIEFTPSINSGILRFPVTYRGEPFLAGVAHNRLDLGWHGPDPICTSAPRGPRRRFSSFTCQGCHGKDTATPFVHISPRQVGEPSQLSEYMTTQLLTVRDECNVTLGFFELRRRRDFQCFLNTLSCPQTPSPSRR